MRFVIREVGVNISKMAAEPDKWSRWLSETRFGGDQEAAETQMRVLIRIRNRLLKRAGLVEGKIVLDVGAGEGLSGFGAVEKVGPAGRVIFLIFRTRCSNVLALPPRKWECWTAVCS